MSTILISHPGSPVTTIRAASASQAVVSENVSQEDDFFTLPDGRTVVSRASYQRYMTIHQYRVTETMPMMDMLPPLPLKIWQFGSLLPLSATINTIGIAGALEDLATTPQYPPNCDHSIQLERIVSVSNLYWNLLSKVAAVNFTAIGYSDMRQRFPHLKFWVMLYWEAGDRNQYHHGYPITPANYPGLLRAVRLNRGWYSNLRIDISWGWDDLPGEDGWVFPSGSGVEVNLPLDRSTRELRASGLTTRDLVSWTPSPPQAESTRQSRQCRSSLQPGDFVAGHASLVEI